MTNAKRKMGRGQRMTSAHQIIAVIALVIIALQGFILV